MSTYIVGLTGGIGSGKTTVSDKFYALGIDVIDADIVAREVVAIASPALSQITAKFGDQILLDDGSLNRSKLREIVFANEQDKQWLNKLLHPLIRQEILAQLAHAKSNYAILVAPLLIENKLTEYVNRVLVIDVPQEVQLQRALKRDSSNENEIKAIINSQCDRQTRLSHADDIVDNSSDTSLLIEQVAQLHDNYLSLAQEKLSK